MARLVDAAVAHFPLEPNTVALKPWTSERGLDIIGEIKELRKQYEDARVGCEMGFAGYDMEYVYDVKRCLTEKRKVQRRQQGLDYSTYLDQMAVLAEKAYESGEMKQVWELEKKLQYKGKVKAVARGLADDDGVVHTSIAEKAAIWNKYFGEKLHAKEAPGKRKEPDRVPSDYEAEPEVTEELEQGWKGVKVGKAAGPDNFVKEMYTALPEETRKEVDKLSAWQLEGRTFAKQCVGACLKTVPKQGKDQALAKGWRGVQVLQCTTQAELHVITARAATISRS